MKHPKRGINRKLKSLYLDILKNKMHSVVASKLFPINITSNTKGM